MSTKIGQLKKTVIKKNLDRALYCCYRLLVQNGESTQNARLTVRLHVTANVSFGERMKLTRTIYKAPVRTAQ